MKPTAAQAPTSKPTLEIKRLTIRSGVLAGRELTPRCSPHNDCGTITG